MELRPDEPAQARNLHDLDQVALPVPPDTTHPGRLIGCLVGIVELVAVAVPLLDRVPAVHRADPAAPGQFAAIGPQTHRAAQFRDLLLVLHQVDDIVGRGRIHLRTVRIGQAQHVPGEFDDHHLHPQADAESREIVLPRIADRIDLALDAPLPEARADDDAIQPVQGIGDIRCVDIFAVDKTDADLPAGLYARDVQALPDALKSVLQVIFPHQADGHGAGQFFLLFHESFPLGQRLPVRRALRQADLLKDGLVQPLLVHIQRNLIDAGHILALDDAVLGNVAEGGDLIQDAALQVLLRPQDQNVGLDTHALEFLDGVLRGLGLELPGCPEVRDIGQVDADGIAALLPAELTDGFHERGALDVADGPADFRDDEIEIPFRCVGREMAFDLIGDMRDDLDGLAQEVPATLLVDDRLVDLAGGHGVVPGRPDAGEALIMAQVQVCFHPVCRDIAFPMLVRVERAGVDVDVGVHLLDGDAVAAGLEEFPDAGRDDSLSKGGDDASRDEDKFGVSHFPFLLYNW